MEPVVHASYVKFGIVVGPKLILGCFSHPQNVFTGDLQPIEYGFIVIVEFTGLIIIDTVAAGSPYPYIVVRSFENFADGIVRQVGVVLVILLEGVAVVFVES